MITMAASRYLPVKAEPTSAVVQDLPVVASSPTTCYGAQMIHACLSSERIALRRLLGLSWQQTAPSTGLPTLESETWSSGHVNIHHNPIRLHGTERALSIFVLAFWRRAKCLLH
ncbi:hypothetical protein CGRA01v4_13315 [Colletotrichum graminicola]|nr:hypothetical protein CGRA01v4_13315 [Colletotrichum graminicola]